MRPPLAPRKPVGAFRALSAPSYRSSARTMTDGIPADYGGAEQSAAEANGKAGFNHMRHRWQARVVRDRRLSRSALAVAGVIWDSMNVRTGDAWPGVTYIARELRMSRASVFRALKQLAERGWINRTRGRNGRSNRYRLAFGPFDLGEKG